MSKKTFTNKEIEILSNNKHVKNVSAKGITYTEEFRNIFIKGKLPRIIFAECGFDINIIGMYRISSAAKRWKKAYKENGVIGLNDSKFALLIKTPGGTSEIRRIEVAKSKG